MIFDPNIYLDKNIHGIELKHWEADSDVREEGAKQKPKSSFVSSFISFRI